MTTDPNAFDFQVTDGDVSYHPWTDGYAIGFEVHHPDGRITFVYLNPSQTSETPDDDPCVFIYTGTAGDPAGDNAHHFYDVTD